MVPVILEPLLKQAETNTLHHALLFCGVDSVDKWGWAKWFAQFVLCEVRYQRQPCGQCRHCRYFNAEDVHPDILILENDASDTVKIDDIRGIAQFLILSPHHAKQKIVLIRNVDALSEASQNALLKILEEPPSYALFILVSDRAKQLLPTIMSRCVKYRFQALSIEESVLRFQSALKDRSKPSITIEMMRAIMLLTEGNVDKALVWLESPIWEYQDVLIDRFIFADEKNRVPLHDILPANALDALYLIYLGMCDLLKLCLGGKEQDLWILQGKHTQIGKKVNRKKALVYIEKIQHAIQDTHKITGMNKLLMFQNLYIFAKVMTKSTL